MPTKTYSIHKFSNENLSNAIENYINTEKLQINNEINILNQKSPFKTLND
mgnify:FL=1